MAGGTRTVSGWFPCQVPGQVGVASKAEISLQREAKAVPRRDWRLMIGVSTD